MAGVKLAFALLTCVLLGCAGVDADPLRSALQSDAPHFAARIENPSQEYDPTNVKTILGPVEMGNEWSIRFDSLLLELLDQPAATFACIPNPGVKVTIADTDRTLRFLICFECSLILAQDVGDRTIKVLGFERHRNELGRLAIEAFPKDRKLADVINGKAPTN
jgi:hypothetical protein